MLTKTINAIAGESSRPRAERIVRSLLERADIGVHGARRFDLMVRDPGFYERVVADGVLGFGESYMDRLWDCDAIDVLTTRLLRAEQDGLLRLPWSSALYRLTTAVLNRQHRWRSFEVARKHYDLGNPLYRRMLDRRMVYSCAHWDGVDDLDAAQEAKLELVCRKLGLAKGMRVLELGCGWGSFARYAAERHGAHVTGLTNSREQAKAARDACRGLPVTIRLDDYRGARGRFDAVVSIGLLEHVGPRNHRTYMKVNERCLDRNGAALIHTIAGNHPTHGVNPWFDKYVFPNAALPTLAQVAGASQSRFVVEDVHNLGEHYDRTLLAWYRRFEDAWPELARDYTDSFRRMWRFYLLTSAGAFRARALQLYQVVLTRTGRPQPHGVRGYPLERPRERWELPAPVRDRPRPEVPLGHN